MHLQRPGCWIAGGACLFILGTVADVPRSAEVRAGHVRTGIQDVRVSRDSCPAYAEPALAVNPRTPLNLLGAAMCIRGTHVIAGTFASFDGGRTWRDDGPLTMPIGTTYSGDVTVAFDSRGTGFVAGLVQAVWGAGVYVWRTEDGGRTFRPPVAVEHGPFADHPALAVDAMPGPSGGTLYVAWRTRLGLAFSRSIDAGRHFAPPRLIVPGDQIYVPTVAAGPRGAVYVAYELQTGEKSAQVAVISSADRGRRFARPVAVGSMADTLMPMPGVTLPSLPSVATDPVDGSVYLTYTDGQTVAVLSRSQPAGQTWSTPLPVTAASHAAGTVIFQPHVAVDDAGGIDVTVFALTARRVAVILARSRSHGRRFDQDQRVSSQPFDPALGIVAGGKGDQGTHWWIGDYQGLAVGGGLIHPFWNDTRTGRLEIFTAAVRATALH